VPCCQGAFFVSWFGLVLGIDGYVRRRKSLDSEKGYTSLKIRFAVEEGVIKELKGKGTKGGGGGGGGVGCGGKIV